MNTYYVVIRNRIAAHSLGVLRDRYETDKHSDRHGAKVKRKIETGAGSTTELKHAIAGLRGLCEDLPIGSQRKGASDEDLL